MSEKKVVKKEVKSIYDKERDKSFDWQITEYDDGSFDMTQYFSWEAKPFNATPDNNLREPMYNDHPIPDLEPPNHQFLWLLAAFLFLSALLIGIVNLVS